MSVRQIGLTLPQRAHFFGAMSLAELVETGHYADESGMFSSLWLGDSLMAKPRPESITILGALASVTTRTKLAVGCMASLPVRDPILLAYQWATLDHLSNGRMLFAACTGIVKPEGASEREGAPYGVVDKSRAGRMEEYIDILRLLWTTENASHHGTYIDFDDVSVLPQPVQSPPPIYIAANPVPTAKPERAQRRVAKMADGWMTVRFNPDMLKDNWVSIKEYLVEEGKDPDEFPVSSYHNVNLNSSRDEALKESKKFLDAYYGPTFDEKAVESWTAAGTVDQVVADLSELYDQGAKEITLRITSWDWKRQLQVLIDEVIPAVQAG